MSGPILMVEGGGSRSTWVLLENGRVVTRHESSGLNPSTITGRQLSEEEQYLVRQARSLKLYTAGYVEGYHRPLLDSLFATVPAKSYKTDIDAAMEAYSLTDGVVVLLGTGSQSAYVEHGDCRVGLPSLGYLVSDEGSGYDMGRRVIRDYIYGRVSGETADLIEGRYDVSRSAMIKDLYHTGHTAHYVASFAQVLSDSPDRTWARAIVTTALTSFVRVRIKEAFGLLDHRQSVYAVGGIAVAFEAIFAEICDHHDLVLRATTADPLALIIDKIVNKTNHK